MAFDDGIYSVSVEEWEAVQVGKGQFYWAALLFPVALGIGLEWAGWNWLRWLAVGGVLYLAVCLFGFLEEINENVRYVRHQLRAFRDGINAANETASRYTNPEETFTPYDLLSTLDREWEYPERQRRRT